jgi:hypothetical protein
MRIDNVIGSVEIHIDTARIDANIKEAQEKLNTQIVFQSTLHKGATPCVR